MPRTSHPPLNDTIIIYAILELGQSKIHSQEEVRSMELLTKKSQLFSLTVSSSLLIITVVSTPSASALNEVTILCLKTGRAAKRTSSGPGVGRPSRIARVFAAKIIYCEALGPAPHDTQFLMKSGA